MLDPVKLYDISRAKNNCQIFQIINTKTLPRAESANSVYPKLAVKVSYDTLKKATGRARLLDWVT